MGHNGGVMFRTTIVGFYVISLSVGLAATGKDAASFDRYDVILQRRPFSAVVKKL